MLHSICEEKKYVFADLRKFLVRKSYKIIGSTSLYSAKGKCHICGRSENLTKFFAELRNFFADRPPFRFRAVLRISYAELSSKCSRLAVWCIPPRKHRYSQSKIQFLYKGHIHEMFCHWIFHERVPPISVNRCWNTFYLEDIHRNCFHATVDGPLIVYGGESVFVDSP